MDLEAAALIAGNERALRFVRPAVEVAGRVAVLLPEQTGREST